MRSFQRLGLILMTGAAGAALSACDGASSVASPGEGTIVIPPAPTPSPTPSPTPTPTPTGGPAASCPSGTTNVGTIGNYRSCRLPSLVNTLTLPRLAGVAYEINGRVDVGVDRGGAGTSGSQGSLTIEPGVLIYANTTNSENDFLIVNRGSTISAEGTEALPIVFTAQENITQPAGFTDESQGLWGGVILAGRAPISNCNLAGVSGGAVNCENVVEGTGNALYGGATPGDNSGVVRYVQIRYSGTVISPNNELQGLTLGGTGSGTVIDRVQVHNSSDDGIEIFGGRTNLRYLVITGADDDGLDVDVGWQGLVQFVIAVQKPGNTQTDNYSTEVDSNGGEDALPRTNYRLANFTFVNTTSATNAAARIRGGADTTFVNGIIQSATACLNIVAGETSATDKSTIRAANATLQDLGPPVFNSIYFACTSALSAQSAVNGITVTTAEQDALVSGGTNNVANGTAANATTSGYLAGSGATGVTAFNAATLNLPAPATPFFVTTSFVGAVGPATTANEFDTWFQNWTCNSNRANFGTGSRACTGLPA